MYSSLSGKTALVTGGAGPNIGSAISKRLANEGMTVVVIDKDEANLEKLDSDVFLEKGSIECYHADVTNEDSFKKTIQRAKRDCGPISRFVNSVGSSSGQRLDEVSEKDFTDQINLNLRSAFLGTKYLLEDLQKQSNASVVYLSSVNALLGGFSEIPYATAKSGLHALARSLTGDYAKDDIRFNTLCVGTVPEYESWMKRRDDMKETRERIANLYPTGRVGKPEEIASAVTYFCSNESSWITGTTVPVDGGITATGNLPGGHWWEKI